MNSKSKTAKGVEAPVKHGKRTCLPLIRTNCQRVCPKDGGPECGWFKADSKECVIAPLLKKKRTKEQKEEVPDKPGMVSTPPVDQDTKGDLRRAQDQILLVSLDQIIADPKKNPRKKPEDKVRFEELKNSILAKGIIVPVIVRPFGDTGQMFELVAGFRRIRAATELKLSSVPAIVRTDLDDMGVAEIQTIENLHREGLDILDEAAGFKDLVTRFKWQVSDIAERMGKSESYIAKRLALTDGPEYIQKAVSENRITLGHAMILGRIQDKKEQKELFDHAADHGWSVRQLYEHVSVERRKIGPKTLFDTTACKTCPWFGPNQKELLIDEVAGRERAFCYNNSCYQLQIQASVKAKIAELEKGGKKVEVLEGYNWEWKWKKLSPQAKKDLVSPKKCEGCENRVMVMQKDYQGEFEVTDTCKKPACTNWKGSLKDSKLMKKAKDEHKKHEEELDQLVEEAIKGITKEQIDFRIIWNLLGGRTGKDKLVKEFMKRFAIGKEIFGEIGLYEHRNKLATEIKKRDPGLWPDMIKVLLILDLRYSRLEETLKVLVAEFRKKENPVADIELDRDKGMEQQTKKIVEIKEGTQKKGGVNTRPDMAPPPPPKGQK